MTEPAVAICQKAVIDFLGSPKAHGGATPERIDTHLSHVFLGPKHVLKLKRAITLDFVDYGTVEKRRAYCDREICANAGWAASLYKGVLPVWRYEDHYGVGPPPEDAEVLDWVVCMDRFNDRDRGDLMLAEGRLSRGVIEGFADDLAARHLAAPSALGQGGADAIRALANQIGEDLIQAIGDWPLRRRAGTWLTQARETLAHNTILANQRAASGHVKRCHGDLHLKNLMLWGDRLIGFDALEFDDHLTTIDTLYDAAFPVMDLIAHKRADLANLCLNRYLAITQDYDGLALMPLFLSLRSAVRALASSLVGDETAAEAYLSLAERMLAPAGRPELIAIGGRSGTGKSTLCRAVAPDFTPMPGAIVVRSDVLRKRLAGCHPDEPLPPSTYTAAQGVVVYEKMMVQACQTISAGYTCILDATFLDPAARTQVQACAKKLGVYKRTIWLDAPKGILRARISNRQQDASDADLSVLESQFRKQTPANWTVVDVSGSEVDSTRRLRAQLQ